MTGGKGSKQGTPQGGVASPMLANLYMNRFLKYWLGSPNGEVASERKLSITLMIS